MSDLPPASRLGRLPEPPLPRPRGMMLLNNTTVYPAPESEPPRMHQSSRKRSAPVAEHEDARPAKRVRVSSEGVELKALHMYEQYTEQVEQMLALAQMQEAKKKDEEKEAQRVALQGELDMKEEERARLEESSADKDARLIALAEDNAAKLKAQEQEYEEKSATHQKEEQTLLARLQAAEAKADDSARQLEAERRDRATEREQWQAQQAEVLALKAQLDAAGSTVDALQRRLEDEQRQRTAAHEQWQTQYTAQAHELAQERQAHQNNVDNSNAWSARAHAEFQELETKLHTSEQTHREYRRKAAETLNNTVASVKQRCSVELQQGHIAKERAERERDTAIAAQAQLESQVTVVKSAAAGLKAQCDTLYNKAVTHYNQGLLANAAFLNERAARQREVAQLQSDRDNVLSQLSATAKNLAEESHKFEVINQHHEKIRHMGELIASQHKVAMKKEIEAKVAYQERAEKAEAKVKQLQFRAGKRSKKSSPKPKPKQEEPMSQTNGFVGFDFGNEDMKDEDEEEFIDASMKNGGDAEEESDEGEDEVDEESRLNDNECNEALKWWDETLHGGAMLKNKLLNRFLPSSTGKLIYLSTCNEHIVQVQPRPCDLMPDQPGNILWGLRFLAGHALEDMEPHVRTWTVERFGKQVVYACLLPTQIAAAQMITEQESIADDLASDGTVQTDALMIRKAAGKFITRMNALNNNSLLDMINERHQNCCHELREHPKIFKDAAQQLANTPQFVQTIIAIVNGQIT